MLTVTATDLPRLMACNGSRLMGGAIPPVNANDTVRDEGNAADWLVQQVFSGASRAEELIDKKAPNGVFITAEMVEYLDEYLNAIVGGQIEVDTSHAGHNWQVDGRADLIKYDPKNLLLKISDLKYGWALVEPEWNWTLISHALGFWFANPGMKIAKVTFTIYQPRPHHTDGRVRSWEIDGVKLTELYHQLDKTLSNPSDLLVTSGHCYRCPALAFCPAARKASLNAIDASEMAFVEDIDNDNLSFQLDHLARASKMLEQLFKAYNELALHRLKQGEIVQNYSIEHELTNRVWCEHVTPEFAQVLTGKDLTKKQLITPAQAEKLGVSKEVVTALTERRQKGLKLARVDANTKASKMFKQ